MSLSLILLFSWNWNAQIELRQTSGVTHFARPWRTYVPALQGVGFTAIRI